MLWGCRLNRAEGSEEIIFSWMSLSGGRSSLVLMMTRVQMWSCFSVVLAELAIRCLDEECVLWSPAWPFYHSSVYFQRLCSGPGHFLLFTHQCFLKEVFWEVRSG